MRYVLFSLAVVVLLATMLPLRRSSAWWIRIFDFPRAQIAVAGAGVWAGIAGLLPPDPLYYGTLVLLAAAIGYQGVRIFPYTPLSAREVPPAGSPTAPQLRLLTANVLMSNRDADRLLALVERCDPDVLLFVETDQWWAEALAPLEASYPHHLLHPLPNTYGMLFYARFPLTEASVCFLIEDDVPSIQTQIELPDGPSVHLRGLHPRPPRPDKNQDSAERDVELLIAARQIQHHEGPVIALGDLNDVAWSHTTRLFQRISELLDPRRGRGLFSTFPAAFPFLRYPLDHVFLSPHFRLVRMKRLSDIGSDHLPLFIEVSYEQEPSNDEPRAPEA